MFRKKIVFLVIASAMTIGLGLASLTHASRTTNPGREKKACCTCATCACSPCNCCTCGDCACGKCGCK